ncbi:haloacid dehalogenase type II [Amycolatopsis sp. 195334CR]|uniref:haloacid dehalogenase type II n=1 Tax=Amycolatopsis sp. 195334CR TaxID=2814588 RepID=UPI001A902FE1|nr:haloacid dehalogenase type II [Amycolatopsis sp. 195334CR]MBN6039765.1 haloacid dehalogenase type II [Amycolatopsis sp. 195334CR]
MVEIRGIQVVVFDVLGTLVDEPRGIRAALPDDEALASWQRHVETEQQRIAAGQRAYADSEAIDREAAEVAGCDDPATVARQAQHLPPWPDSVAGLDRLAQRFPVIGLSNASRTALLRISAHAGLRWHTALSGETVRAYKPSPEVYRLAIDVAACPPESVLMVAAHAWDLRGAQAAGMRTAYVERPVGDPPAATDAFDGRFGGLDELVNALGSP